MFFWIKTTMRQLLYAILTFFLGAVSAMSFTFSNIDGGTINTSEWKGKPFLVVNSASQCGFTKQYRGLQKLFDTYKNEGLIVLAVPSNDFKQELKSNSAVKDFCELDLGLDIPITEITSVKGSNAHPFFQWVKDQSGFTPKWNFNKVLISKNGELVNTYGSLTKPNSRKLIRDIEQQLALQ